MGGTHVTEFRHEVTPGEDRTMMLAYAERTGVVDIDAFRRLEAHRDSLLQEINDALNGGLDRGQDAPPTSFEGIKDLRKLIGALMRRRRELIAEVGKLRLERNMASFALGQVQRRITKEIAVVDGDAKQIMPLDEVVGFATRLAIQEAVEVAGSVAAAAEALHLSRSHLYRLMVQHGLKAGADGQ